MSKKWINIIVVILLLLISVCVVINYYSTKGERSFIAHLENKTLKIESFEITYQQIRVECNNKKVCSYLSNIFTMRNRELLGNCSSISYQIKITYNNGETFICHMPVGEDGFCLSIPQYASEINFPTHCYNLKDAPVELKEIHNFLNFPLEQSRGKVLIVNDNESKIIFDKSLIMP